MFGGQRFLATEDFETVGFIEHLYCCLDFFLEKNCGSFMLRICIYKIQ